jgi:hypothetical protein
MVHESVHAYIVPFQCPDLGKPFHLNLKWVPLIRSLDESLDKKGHPVINLQLISGPCIPHVIIKNGEEERSSQWCGTSTVPVIWGGGRQNSEH